jgi:hypothetical protein
MTRQTPIAALLLAPLLLYALFLLWKWAAVPLYRAVWQGETAVQWRLDSADARAREQAVRSAMSLRPTDEVLVAKVVGMMRNDPAPAVRASAASALGGLGAREPLPPPARQALIEAVLAPADAAITAAAIGAIGASAANTTYPDEVARRIAQTLADPKSHAHYAVPEALGRLGAAQPLPPEVFDALNEVFARPDKTGIREPLARAFVQMAAGRPLPTPTLDLLAAVLQGDRNERIRSLALLALAHSADAYAPAEPLIIEALQDANRNVQASARNGVRIIENRRWFSGRTPVEAALDRSAPVPARLRGIELMQVRRDDALSREQIVTLASDEDAQVAVAALGKLNHAAFSPEKDFDRQRLIPVLRAAMAHGDPKVRVAAFGALGRLFAHGNSYRNRADDFRVALEAGAADADADVRIVAMATQLRAEPGAAEADAIRARALQDADPRVRRSAAGWLGSARARYDDRPSLIDKALQDPVAAVRASAEAAQRQWQSQRDAWWPRKLLQMLRDGEYGKLGLTVLTFFTIATPVVIGAAFVLYYTARLLTYTFQRRWRALAVLPVMAVWWVASAGMFLLYFTAGHAHRLDRWETFVLAAILWAAIALYAGLGWGMHYLVRR